MFGLDGDGFYRPTVDTGKCTDCGICTKVCYKYLPPTQPFENTFKGKPVYGAWSKDIETVKASSSGGVGHELTTYFFEKGYKVCGCVFDAPDDICKHIIAGEVADLEAIRTSKYLQSYTVDAFSQFGKDEKYLVVGTPCQIYGLRKWIETKRWEDNFVLVDFFCHGTPSFNLWKKYKDYLSDRHGLQKSLSSINFRMKNHESNWHSYAISIRDSSGKKFERNRAFANDLFFRFFLNDSCLNDSCHQCKLRLDHCVSDIRIADFWGKKYAANEWGVNLVIANTEKGAQAFEAIKPALNTERCTFADLQDSQSIRFLSPNKKREAALKDLCGDMSLELIYQRYFRMNKTLIYRITRRVIRTLRSFPR
jgi:coenzyme F420-reducing hydrogenase beta subunit